MISNYSLSLPSARGWVSDCVVSGSFRGSGLPRRAAAAFSMSRAAVAAESLAVGVGKVVSMEAVPSLMALASPRSSMTMRASTASRRGTPR